MFYVNGRVDKLPGEGFQLLRNVNVQVSTHAGGEGYTPNPQRFVNDFLQYMEGHDGCNVAFYKGFAAVLFKPVFGFFKIPTFTLIKKVALNGCFILALKLPYNGFNALILAKRYSAKTVWLKILWAAMPRTNILVRLFPGQSKPALFRRSALNKYIFQKINRIIQWDGQKMAKNYIVRVVLSPQHKELLDRICQKLGQSESETLRIAFLQYAEKLSLITEKVHGKI